jgi:hypothetical protein
MDKVKACPKFKNEPKSFSGVFIWELYNCGNIICSDSIMLQISIIFMYLHKNNPMFNVRFSIPSKNFHKNSPKYYDAVNLSSFT